MDVTPLISKDKQILNGYGAGGFKINNELYMGSLLILPDRTEAWHPPTPFDPQCLLIVLEQLQQIDIILVGTGNSMVLIPPAIRSVFKARHISLDAMNTGAACRTYNVLLSEERRVAAALVAV